MKNTYWNNSGKYQTEYSRMANELMPDMGNCETVAGELIRAVSRIAYDLYNNGMGNNTSGALNYLLSKGAIDNETYATIYPYTRGALYEGRYKGDEFQVAVESAVDQTIETILSNPTLLTKSNTEDMFDYEEEDQHWCEECGDELEDTFRSTCRSCEEEYDEEFEEDELYCSW